MGSQIEGTVEEAVGLPICRHERSGKSTATVREVQRESLLTVRSEGHTLFQTGCSANHLEELITGRLVSEGLADSLDDIGEISVEFEPMQARVTLKHSLAPRLKEDWSPPPPSALAAPSHLVREGVDGVFQMMDVFANDLASHQRTRGTHSAYLWRGGALQCRREDIGRHNALDKVLGFALRAHIPLRECAIFISSRIPADFAMKVVRARVPLLVSKATVTDRTVHTARTFRLTLVGNARDNAMDVFSDPFGMFPVMANQSYLEGRTQDSG